MLPAACRWFVATLMFLAMSAALRAAEFTTERTEHGVKVLLDGQLLTEYLFDAGPKPYLWPLVGPHGEPITRAFPMRTIEGERHDHPHQRSFWFTHGDVNDVSFWHEGPGAGRTVHREFETLEGGSKAVIKTRNDWIDADGKKHLEDVRTITFSTDGETRVIDFDITLMASYGPVTFGDTKEGTFGVRVPTEMDVDSKRGGRIVNSEGDTDSATWGKQAAWVDYHGPIGGETVGVAILNHPSSFRHPTYWHVRTYGLFAANPFGWHDFRGSAEFDGSHTLDEGESIDLRYRVLLHKGDAKAADVAGAYADYAAEKK